MNSNVLKKVIIFSLFLLLFPSLIFSQSKVSIAVIGIDTKGITLDNVSMENLVRLELEKANIYEVLDKYDVSNILQENNIDPTNCFGKTKLISVGNMLKVDKILTGNVDKFGDKIIFVLRMIDIKSKKIENTNVMEYLDLQKEIQAMAKISVNNLIEVENNPMLVELLVSYEQMIQSPKTTVSLNGPRMGASMITGNTGSRLAAPEEQGGYNMFPISSIFGYQYERQYLSSGDFQALVEGIFAVSGLESGIFIPSVSLMNGFRFNKKGWEIGLGPIFRASKIASGYYDENNSWHLENEMLETETYEIIDELDARGTFKLSTNLIVAFGKTFRSGYLNIPVNIYYVPNKSGSTIGLIVGFNIAKKQKIE